MKHGVFLFVTTLALLSSGCVSIEMPGLVSETAQVAKDAYRAVKGDKAVPVAAGASAPAAAASAPPPAPVKVASPAQPTLVHAYIGSDTQTIGDIKQACVAEAAQKLTQLSGKTVRYTVTENTIAVINGKPVANCRLLAEG